MNFDFDTLYNECRRESFTAGKELFYDDAVKNVRLAVVDGKSEIRAIVKGSPDVKTLIVFDEDGGLYDYECDCGEANPAHGPCAHVIASALSYEEKHPTATIEVTARKSDADVVKLVFDYNRKKSMKLMSSEITRADVIPYLSFEGGINLSLTVGFRKQYVVKDVSVFVNDFKDCKYKRYGVALEIYHALGSFSEQSQKLIDFVIKCIEERGADYLPENPASIKLTGGELDVLYSLYSGRLVSKTRSEQWALASEDTAFPVKFIVSKVNGGYVVKTNCREIDFIKGRDFRYALVGNRIYRLSADTFDLISALATTLNGGRELFVADGDMVQFYNSVLKPVSASCEVESEGVDLSEMATPTLECKIFIKSEDKRIVAEVNSAYYGQAFDLLSDSYVASHLRDWDAEDAIRTTLAKYFVEYPTLEIASESEIFHFLKKGIRELCSHAEVLMTESMAKLRVRQLRGLKVGVRLSSDILSVSLSSDEFDEHELKQILEAYRNNQRYVLLGGGFVDLDDRSLEAISGALQGAIEREGDFALPAYYASLISEELEGADVTYEKDESFDELIKALAEESLDVSALPKDMQRVMREYQKVGYNWLDKLSRYGFGGILADDMGLGKTLQVLALLTKNKSRSLIVCPTTLMLNWQEEIKKFAPSLRSKIVMGAQPDRKAMIENSESYDVIITSYDLIRRDYELYSDIEFDFAIVDEAQNIKNPETKNAVSIKTLKASHKFALTGTPVENHLGELWSIFDFVMPGFLGTYQDFREEYEEGIVAGDDDVAEKFKKLITPFILRRLKTDVLKELPPKIESKQTVILSDEQKSLYKANMYQLKNSLRFDENANRVEVLSMIMRLRQICCHPSLVYPDYHGNSAKLESCMELVRSAVEGGHKILLFSQFTSMLDIIKAELAKNNITFYLLTGENPKAERLKLVKQFNEDETNVFLISLKAGGTGLNLTGADIVIHYDPWWNESVMNQATDRAYRLGQNKSVQVYKLIMENTLEEKIYELQQKKTALSNMVVGKENDIKDIIRIIKEEE